MHCLKRGVGIAHAGEGIRLPNFQEEIVQTPNQMETPGNCFLVGMPQAYALNSVEVLALDSTTQTETLTKSQTQQAHFESLICSSKPMLFSHSDG